MSSTAALLIRLVAEGHRGQTGICPRCRVARPCEFGQLIAETERLEARARALESIAAQDRAQAAETARFGSPAAVYTPLRCSYCTRTMAQVRPGQACAHEFITRAPETPR